MAALPYIQLYVADYLSDTMHLEADEHGAYLLLIMNYWQTGKPINQKHIKAITKLSNERYANVIETLQDFFNIDDNGLWFHKRIEADLAKVREKSTKASDAGKKSAEIRWKNKEKVTNVITNVITDVNETLQRNCNHTDTDINTDKDIKDISNEISSESEKKTKKGVTVFKKPSEQEIIDYCMNELNTNFDAGKFLDYYESNGWMVSRAKMKDWKSTVRNWIRRDQERNIQKSPDVASNNQGSQQINQNSGINYATRYQQPQRKLSLAEQAEDATRRGIEFADREEYWINAGFNAEDAKERARQPELYSTENSGFIYESYATAL